MKEYNQTVNKKKKQTKKTYLGPKRRNRHLGPCCFRSARLQPLGVLGGMGVGVAGSDGVVMVAEGTREEGRRRRCPWWWCVDELANVAVRICHHTATHIGR
jgi:hypothetical protein